MQLIEESKRQVPTLRRFKVVPVPLGASSVENDGPLGSWPIHTFTYIEGRPRSVLASPASSLLLQLKFHQDFFLVSLLTPFTSTYALSRFALPPFSVLHCCLRLVGRKVRLPHRLNRLV